MKSITKNSSYILYIIVTGFGAYMYTPFPVSIIIHIIAIIAFFIISRKTKDNAILNMNIFMYLVFIASILLLEFILGWNQLQGTPVLR